MSASTPAILAFFNVGPWEAVMIGLVALLLFGRRLPEVMRSLGKGVVEFKKGMRDVEEDMHRSVDDTRPPPPPSLPENPPPSGRYIETPPAEPHAKP